MKRIASIIIAVFFQITTGFGSVDLELLSLKELLGSSMSVDSVNKTIYLTSVDENNTYTRIVTKTVSKYSTRTLVIIYDERNESESIYATEKSEEIGKSTDSFSSCMFDYICDVIDDLNESSSSIKFIRSLRASYPEKSFDADEIQDEEEV